MHETKYSRSEAINFTKSVYDMVMVVILPSTTVLAGTPVPDLRHEATNKVPADWSSESSGVHQVDEMVPGVTLSAGRTERSYLIQDIC